MSAHNFKPFILAAIISLGVIGSIPAPAQSPPVSQETKIADRAKPDQNRLAKPDPLFVVLDTDRDGALSAAELHNAAAVLKQLDKNNDGRLTRDELGAGGQERGKRGKGKEGKRGGGKGKKKPVIGDQ